MCRDSARLAFIGDLTFCARGIREVNLHVRQKREEDGSGGRFVYIKGHYVASPVGEGERRDHGIVNGTYLTARNLLRYIQLVRGLLSQISHEFWPGYQQTCKCCTAGKEEMKQKYERDSHRRPHTI